MSSRRTYRSTATPDFARKAEESNNGLKMINWKEISVEADKTELLDAGQHHYFNQSAFNLNKGETIRYHINVSYYAGYSLGIYLDKTASPSPVRVKEVVSFGTEGGAYNSDFEF